MGTAPETPVKRAIDGVSFISRELREHSQNLETIHGYLKELPRTAASDRNVSGAGAPRNESTKAEAPSSSASAAEPGPPEWKLFSAHDIAIIATALYQFCGPGNAHLRLHDEIRERAAELSDVFTYRSTGFF